MVDFVNNVRYFVNCAIFCGLCDRMRSEVDCAKSHNRVISEGLLKAFNLYRPHCCSALSVRQEGFGFLDINLCIVNYASNTMMLNEESLTFVIAKYLWNSKTKC